MEGLRAGIGRILDGIDGAVWGVADLRRAIEEHPHAFAAQEVVRGFQRAVVVAVPLPRGALCDVRNAPTPLYMHHYRQLNYLLDRLAYRIALHLEAAGFRSVAIAASQYIATRPRPKGHLSHKVLAYYAGLGWLGRNNLLITPQHGPRVRLVSVLTRAPLGTAQKFCEFGCGDCRECLKACPAGAIGETASDYNLDACFAQLQEFAKIRFVGQHICGLCIAACPRAGI